MFRKATTTPPVEGQWWRGSERDAARGLCSIVDHTIRGQKGREHRNALFARLYGGLSYMAGLRFSSNIAAQTSGIANPMVAQGPRRNLIYSAVDTVCSKIGGQDTKVTFLTADGDWELQQKAKLLDQFVQGIFYQVKFLEEARRVLRDACVFGTGIMKFEKTADKNIAAHRVFPNEVWCDMWDGRDLTPRRLYQVDYEDRDVLAARYPSARDAIMKQPAVSNLGPYSMQAQTNVVQFYEGWSLRSSEEADDGRHLVALPGIETPLNAGETSWTWDEFPFAILRFLEPLVGFWGQGLSELGIGHQRELNRVLMVEAQSHRLMSVPRVWADVASKINANHLQSNTPGMIGFYRGAPPTVLNWQATTANFVEYKQWIIEDLFEMIGIDRNTAEATKPPGLDSAVAQREWKDQQGERLVLKSGGWDSLFLNGSRICVRLARELYEDGTNLSVKVHGKDFIRTIPWKSINLDDDEFSLKLWPTSMLPQSPAGRLAAVQELFQAGLISRDDGLALLQFPDLDRVLGLQNASRDNIEKTIDAIFVDGKFVAPDPMQDLAQGSKDMLAAYLRASTMNWKKPEEKAVRMELARRWLKAAQRYVAPRPVAAGPAGSPPQAVGPTAPVSPFLPPRNLPAAGPAQAA